MKTTISLSLLILAATSFCAFSADVGLPKTGQTTSFLTGDDGDLEKGMLWPTPRFTDNGDGTISDKLTGLIWEKSPSATTKTWVDAISYAQNITVGGYDDWRLPNINELKSLINAGEIVQADWLNSQGFSGVIPGGFIWSSTTYDGSAGRAWTVNSVGGAYYGLQKTGYYYVLAVRGGQ